MSLNDISDSEMSLLCGPHAEIVTISLETMEELRNKSYTNHAGTVAQALHDAYYLFFSWLLVLSGSIDN